MPWWDIGDVECAHCRMTFTPTRKQAARRKYEGQQNLYCSRICQNAAVAAQLTRPVPEHGPCPTCGEMFRSKTAKMFCSMACYTKSEQFARHHQAISVKGAAATGAKNRAEGREVVPCIQCGNPIDKIKSSPRKYCSQSCYRRYMADRFDRWIANPQNLALPQAYDEFLTKAELPCLVDGCGWSGNNLSLHMNLAHGVNADEFKRAAGFNLNTGVVSAPLSDVLSGAAHNMTNLPKNVPFPPDACCRTDYRSLEGREHRAKAIALRLKDAGPLRVCVGCGEEFQQSTPFGRAKFCCIPCRDAAYRRKPAEAA